MAQSLEIDLDNVLGALTHQFASDGDTRAVAILAMSKARIEQTNYDRWDGGQYYFTVYLEVPQTLYVQVSDSISEIDESFKEKVASIESIGFTGTSGSPTSSFLQNSPSIQIGVRKPEHG